MKRKSFTFILLALVGACIVVLPLIYWFEYRPDEIRYLCQQEQEAYAQHPNKHRRVRSYQQCLEENGLRR